MANARRVLVAEQRLGWNFSKGISRGRKGEYDYDPLVEEINRELDKIKQSFSTLEKDEIQDTTDILHASNTLFRQVGPRVWPGQSSDPKPFWVSDAGTAACGGHYQRNLSYFDQTDREKLRRLFFDMVVAKARAFRQNQKHKQRSRNKRDASELSAPGRVFPDGDDDNDCIHLVTSRRTSRLAVENADASTSILCDSLDARDADMHSTSTVGKLNEASHPRPTNSLAEHHASAHHLLSQVQGPCLSREAGSDQGLSRQPYDNSSNQARRYSHLNFESSPEGSWKDTTPNSCVVSLSNSGHQQQSRQQPLDLSSRSHHFRRHRSAASSAMSSQEYRENSSALQQFRDHQASPVENASAVVRSKNTPDISIIDAPDLDDSKLWDAPFSADGERIIDNLAKQPLRPGTAKCRDSVLDLLRRIDLVLIHPATRPIHVNLARCISRKALFDRVDREVAGRLEDEEVVEISFADEDLPAEIRLIVLRRTGFRDQYRAFLQAVRQIDNGMDAYYIEGNIRARPRVFKPFAGVA